jgi:hypothetical protein
MGKVNRLRLINIGLTVAGLISILFFILCGKKKMAYDEFNFVPNIFLLDKEGLTKSFLLNIKGSAGPTYAIYHHLFFDAQSFDITSVRLANYFLLLVLLCFIFLNARLLQYKDPLILTLNFIVIPFAWVFCGLGLTEIPAMSFATMGFYLLLKGLITAIQFQYKFLYSLGAGMLFSFAILGRSFYLMAIIAVFVWLIINLLLENEEFRSGCKRFPFFSSKGQGLLLIVIFMISSLVLPLMVFDIWGALTPPLGTEAVGAKQLAIVPWYGILAFAYSGSIALILAPSFFVVNRKVVYSFLAITLLLVLSNLFLNVYEFIPLHTTMERLLPANLFLYYGRVLPGIFASVSLYFIYSTACRLWANRNDSIYLLIGIITLFIVFATVKVTTQFSSRYVGQVLPFFVLLFAPYEKINWQKIVRISLGLFIGILSLYSYYTVKY